MFLYSGILLICLVLKLSVGLPQASFSVTPSLATTGVDSLCDGCTLIADFASITFGTPIESTIIVTNDGSSDYTVAPTEGVIARSTLLKLTTLIEPTVFIMIETYDLVSTFLSSGLCTIYSRSLISVPGGGFSIGIPSASENVQFHTAAESSFKDYIGLPSCDVQERIEKATTTTPLVSEITNFNNSILPLYKTPPPSSTAVLSSTAQTSSLPTSITNSTFSSPQRVLQIAVGTTIPIVFVLSILIALTYWRQYRNRRLSSAQSNLEAVESSTGQAFLQQKAELDAEAVQQYETEANETRYELPYDNDTHELSTRGIKRQELRGEEHCRELADKEKNQVGGKRSSVSDSLGGSSKKALARTRRSSLMEFIDELFSKVG